MFVPKDNTDTGKCPENIWYYPKGTDTSSSSAAGATITTGTISTPTNAEPATHSGIIAVIGVDGNSCLKAEYAIIPKSSGSVTLVFTKNSGSLQNQTHNGTKYDAYTAKLYCGDKGFTKFTLDADKFIGVPI